MFASIIDNKMPARYDNLKRIGIVDAFKGMDKTKVGKKFENAENTTLRFLKIYIQDFDYYEEKLKNAIIKGNCTVEVLLLDKNADEAINKRANSLNKNKTISANIIKQKIEHNIASLESLWNKLPKEKQDSGALQLKLHNSFIATSLIGIGEEYYMGMYLRDVSAPNGVIFKIAGSYRILYKYLNHHFEKEWEDAKPYKFK